VNAIKLVNDGDFVVGMDMVLAGADLLIVTTNGVGKRTPLDEFPTHGRYGQGVIAMRLSPRTGKIVACRVVRESDDVMLMSTSGMVVRVQVKDISQQGRATQGVNIMTLSKTNDLIASVAVIREDQNVTRDNAAANGNGEIALATQLELTAELLAGTNAHSTNGHTDVEEVEE
jgi:DNA gyrase subunit A